MDEIQIERLLTALEQTSKTLKTISDQLTETNQLLAEQSMATRTVTSQLHNVEEVVGQLHNIDSALASIDSTLANK